jgi:hypothetical protein
MEGKHMLTILRNRVRQARWALALCVCAALTAAQAAAQSQTDPPAKSPSAGNVDKAAKAPADEATPPPTAALTEIKVTPDARAAKAVKAAKSEEWVSGCDKGKGGQPTVPSAQYENEELQQSVDPAMGPRFVCDSMVSKGEQIWQGQPAVFSFTIRNEGQGELRINAKGG